LSDTGLEFILFPQFFSSIFELVDAVVGQGRGWITPEAYTDFVMRLHAVMLQYVDGQWEWWEETREPEELTQWAACHLFSDVEQLQCPGPDPTPVNEDGDEEVAEMLVGEVAEELEQGGEATSTPGAKSGNIDLHFVGNLVKHDLLMSQDAALLEQDLALRTFVDLATTPATRGTTAASLIPSSKPDEHTPWYIVAGRMLELGKKPKVVKPLWPKMIKPIRNIGTALPTMKWLKKSGLAILEQQQYSPRPKQEFSSASFPPPRVTPRKKQAQSHLSPRLSAGPLVSPRQQRGSVAVNTMEQLEKGVSKGEGAVRSVPQEEFNAKNRRISKRVRLIQLNSPRKPTT